MLLEFIGTFIFLSVILGTGEVLPIAIALAAAIFFGGKYSGGNFNPAVSFMMFLNTRFTNYGCIYAQNNLLLLQQLLLVTSANKNKLF